MKLASRKLAVIAAGLLCSTTVASAATVRSVNKAKMLVVIEGIEEEDGIAPDGSVCVHDEADKNLGCGVVLKQKKASAQVKFKSKKAIAKIKKGMVVRAKDASAKAGDNVATKDAPAAKGKKGPFRIWASFSPALSTPATYNKLAYKLPSSTSPDSIWEVSEASKTAFIAFNFEVGIPLSSFSINPGFRYRSYTDAQVDADYNATNSALFARSVQTGSAMGFWVDFQYLNMNFSSSSNFFLTSGIDMDMSTVNFKATSMDDTGAAEDKVIAEAKSSLSVISLRLGAGFDYMFVKSFGAHLGTTVMIPVTEMGKSFSGSVDDANSSAMADPLADLETSLGHKKNSVAYEATLGLVLAF